ncbi:DUF689-domain-containing protein [Linderina pennispora]|uniref:DUF689-domain-containing protein n=1 Tax=Linderina pennispora TaxID=61395 RepID=A0A1Y1WDH7_9FUNG|nr:DUF689-domain-containing protein [Linderina pennispora]ORX71286.1 DUF689-domain-containing protein [Linderina pennispora]
MSSYTAQPGHAVLLVARASADAHNLDSLQQLRDTLAQQVGTTGTVDFEQADRIADGSAVLGSARYDHIIASPVAPYTVEYSRAVLAALLNALKPGAVLTVNELALDSATDLPESPVTRTQEELVAQTKFAGFVEPHLEAAAVGNTELEQLVQNVWRMAGAQEFLQTAAGRVSVASVTAKKPAYNVGSAAALSFGKKRAAKKVWMINVASDDEDEIEDQDDLLEAEDLARPDAKSLARPDGLPAKRKACKNCTCGLADGEEPDPTKCKPSKPKPKPKKPVDVVNVKSACGNCSLGDAFRCTSCPYMGMPAFKPGDKITLGGSLLHDDFIP